MKIIVAIILLLCELSILSQPTEKDLERLEKNFTKNEIADIVSIVSTFDSFVLKQTNRTGISEAYPKYIDTLNVRLRQYGNSSYSHQLLLDSILNTIDSTLADELFIEYTPRFIYIPKALRLTDTIIHNPDSLIIREFNTNNRFMDYFVALGKSDEYFKAATQTCIEQGCISPTVLGYILFIHDFDFDDFNYRLWVSLALLSIEEPLLDRLLNYKNCIN